MAITSKISSRGQITLPKTVRQRFGLEEGQSVAFVIKNDELTLIPLKHTLLDFEGSVEVEGEQDFEAVRNTVKQQQGERLARGE